MTASAVPPAVMFLRWCFDTPLTRSQYAQQEGLKAQQSRMDVDLPFAARLGVETSDEDKNKKVCVGIHRTDSITAMQQVRTRYKYIRYVFAMAVAVSGVVPRNLSCVRRLWVNTCARLSNTA